MVGYDFPNNPVIGQRVEVAARVYQWNGKGWQIVATEFDPVISDGGSGVWYVQDDKPVDAERGSGWLKCDEHATFMNAGTKEVPIWVELGPEFTQAADLTDFNDYGICEGSFLTNGDFSDGLTGWTAYSSGTIPDPALRIETTIGNVVDGVAINSPDGVDANIMVVGPSPDNNGGWASGFERIENLPAEFIGLSDVKMDLMMRWSVHNHTGTNVFNQNDNVGVLVEAFDAGDVSLGQVFGDNSAINGVPPQGSWRGGGWAYYRRFYGQVPLGTTYFKIRFQFSGSGAAPDIEFAIDKICPRCYRAADVLNQAPANLMNLSVETYPSRNLTGIVFPFQDDWAGGSDGYSTSRQMFISDAYTQYSDGIPALYIGSTGYDNIGFGFPPHVMKPIPQWFRHRLAQGGNVNAIMSCTFTAVLDNDSDFAQWYTFFWDENGAIIQNAGNDWHTTGDVFGQDNVPIGTAANLSMYNDNIPQNAAYLGFGMVSEWVRNLRGVVSRPSIRLSAN